MTPDQLDGLLTKVRSANPQFGRKAFCERLAITEASFSFWLKTGWMTYERQCSVQIEIGKMVAEGVIPARLRREALALKASWEDVPEDKRPAVAA